MKQPQILTLNLNSDVVKILKEKDYNIYEGSQGFQIKLDIPYNSYKDCLLRHRFPSNFHEYDMVILDQTNDKIIDYKQDDHKITDNKTTKEHKLRCRHPKSLFDPRPLSLTLLGRDIVESLKKPFMLVAFCAREESVEYEPSESGYNVNTLFYSNYGFLPYQSDHLNKDGIKTKVADGNQELLALLRKYNEKFSYNIIFRHPTIYMENSSVPDPSFFPLVYNQDNEIISYLRVRPSGSKILMLPRLEDKIAFLTEFLEEVAPTLVPAIFPDEIKNSWVTSERYHLPNQAILLFQKATLLKKQAEDLAEVENAIVQNTAENRWLHDMLTTTDDELVTAVIKFLEWLGFKNPKDYDKINKSGINEEDIQIETNKGLLILEVKGIGGTSKDSDCGQVGKIRSRRIQQLKKFDVYAVYIVNHQRHMPPHERKNPPFTDHQMSDANYDERGLMTTWQLFNLYFLIEKGILTKEQAREAFFNYGYIDFIPKSFVSLGIPSEYFRNNTVAIITLSEKISLTVGEELFTTHNDNYQKVKIKSLKVNDQAVTLATGTEIGIQFEQTIVKGTILYKMA